MGRVDIINSTLGKALGGAAGGYTTGPRELIDLLKQRSRPYLFSNTLPPAVVASASKVIDLLMQSSVYPQRVQSNTERFRTKMVAAGFNIGGAEHAICPVMLGEARLASVFADEMLSKTLFFLMAILKSFYNNLPNLSKNCGIERRNKMIMQKHLIFGKCK